MACVNPPASVHAGVRVVAKASSSAGRRARADGILAASHRRRGAVRTPARWTAAAPFRGVHLFERRAPAPAHVLCEPSRADVGSDDELDPVAARAARDIRRRRASAEADALPERLSARHAVGNKKNETESRDPRGAALGLAEAKSTMRAMRQTQAVQTQATRAKTPARRDATETRASSKSGDAKEPETPRRAAEPEPVAPRPGPARAADALKRLSLNPNNPNKSKKPVSKPARKTLKSPPVDAEAAAAVFGGGEAREKAAGAAASPGAPAPLGDGQKPRRLPSKKETAAQKKPGSRAHRQRRAQAAVGLVRGLEDDGAPRLRDHPRRGV